MRNIFLLLGLVGGLLCPALAHAQTGNGPTTVHATITWKGYTEVVSRAEKKQRVPSFEGASQLFGEQVGVFNMRLDGAVAQGEMLNAVYEPFTEADAKLFDASKLPASPQPTLVQGTEMKHAMTRLSVRPVRRSPQSGQLEKLVSFDYSYTPTAARGTATTRVHADHSVLRQGDWYKLGVAESGVFKLDKAVLRRMGLNPQNINPNQLKLYGNSMGMLPQPNDAYRPDDLAEASMMLVGNNGDNNFDDAEYFLFYSPGPHTWKASGGVFRHTNNIYADTTYYFVTVGGTPGAPRRVTANNGPTAGSRTITNLTTYTDHQYWEQDRVNILHSGRQWLGEGFNTSTNSTRNFAFNFTDLVPGSTARVTAALAASSLSPSRFNLTLSGAALSPGIQAIDARSTQSYTPTVMLGVQDRNQFPLIPYITHLATLPASPGNTLSVSLNFASGDGQASGYLDYLELNVERRLSLGTTPMEFRSLVNFPSTSTLNNFTLTNATGAIVWDVTDPREPVARPLNNGAFLAATDLVREFVAFQPGGSFPGEIRAFGKVTNQDLHAIDGTTDLVIVTYPPFKGQAERLAEHRRTHDNLKVKVVTTTEVYNEFSSGGQDVTAIRDLMKQVYDRAPAGKYLQLLLFGDASYDYKSDFTNDKAQEPTWWKTDRTPFRTDADFDAANQNYVPTYESRESQAPFGGGQIGTSTYSSEDYYALLDDNEGEWSENGSSAEMFDIGVGRLPIRTPKGSPNSTTQAEQVVSKIISYDDTTSYGKWRNRVTLTTDDGDGNLFINSSIGSEGLANIVSSNHPEYNVHKVYLDMYPQVSVSAGQRSPACNLAIDQSFEQGSLLINYLGHGGPKAMADEQIITSASVLSLLNTNKLTFLVTGTCDFSTYDNPDLTSAGEEVLTDNSSGGAVGLFTTTRVVDAFQNADLVAAFFRNVFQPINGVMPRIGQVIMLTKNSNPSNINDRNYVLMADPSMRLAYPEQTVVLDSLNGQAVSATNSTATLKALDKVRLRGRVLNNGALNANFNGTAQITVYDKPTTVMTLGDEPVDTPLAIPVQESVVYGGQATVVNGRFTLTFIVPKDINYNVGIGKVSMYASDSRAQHEMDAHGYQLVPVGGAAQNPVGDSIPPDIALFMDTDSFVFGGLTASTTTLIAKLSDASGINTTGAGIGHEITAIIDRDPTKLLVLNDSYVSSVNDFTSGRIDNLYKDLSAGPHTITLKAWDTYNNSAQREIEFVVATTEKLALDHVLNYPNPFSNVTTFHFDTNHSGDELDVQVQIFTVSGKLVRTLRATDLSGASHQSSISWNGRDEYDDQLARGVYIYRVNVRSMRDQTTASKYEKLVILN